MAGYPLQGVRDESGHVVQWFGTSTDVTEQHRAAEDREHLLARERDARAEAERAGRMKDEFLATLSHELRTPMNAILGWSQVLRSSNATDPEDIRQRLETIERNARARTTITEDLLDMSRIISGKVRLDVQPVDLAGTVRAAAERVQPAADAKGVRVRVVLDPMAGPISGDPNRWQQVFWNLLTNAVKFTPKGGRVQVTLARVNSHVEITVADNGEGIRPEFLPHVFDRLRQADPSTTRRHGGLGLGLSIVKQLIELHGGCVEVCSDGPGHGSTFVVALPPMVVQGKADPEVESRHPRSAPMMVGLPESCDDITGIRVLVVDDEPDARTLIQRLLEDRNAVVMTAGSVDEALGHLTEREFDVWVSDIGMPEQDGYDLIRQIRSRGDGKGWNIPAIALTAYARSEDRVRAVSAGFTMHVTKPIGPVELATMVVGAAGRTGRS
ncbi:MAG TPA: ATP-binding protein [Tepidisphaeraceae bacterium]|jgi:hypothetical protein|nr:ATP-binding protein [Tepidisphaeraceae bacterium]